MSATASSATLAAAIANTYVERFVAEQQRNSHRYYSSALKLVDKRLAALTASQRAGQAGLALQSRAQSLAVLAELQTGNVQIAQRATTPTSPSSPRVSRNTLIGAVLGLLIGLTVAFLLQRFDRRIREPETLAAIYRAPLLGAVPKSRAIARSAREAQGHRVQLPYRESEAFHLIRAHLRYFNIDREVRTLLVTSTMPGDGKTTVAHHLATAAATVGSSVLLLEADLRDPSIASQVHLAPGPGVVDVLAGSVSLRRATQPITLDPAAEAAPLELDVLVAGTPEPPNPAELIESEVFAALLEQARGIYDLVVIDASPLSVVSDAFPLLRRVDGVVIVGWMGRNRRGEAERLRETLAAVGTPLLGVIANGTKITRRDSYARHYEQVTNRDGTVWRSGSHPTAGENGASSVRDDVARSGNGMSRFRRPVGDDASLADTPRSTTRQ